MHVQALTR